MHLHKKMMFFSKKRMMQTKTIRYKINEETESGVRKEKMIMFDLTGNVAVVTGASAGLGRQFALALARQGADVAILARRKEKLEGVAEEIRALGVKCLPVQCDVTQIDQIQGAVDEVVKGLGTVDILVNNAGGGSCIPLEDLPDEEWRKVLSLDLDGAFYCMKYFGRVMLEKGYGRVINISSILGKGGLKELPVIAYASAKGGVINMTRQAAIEWATKGVTVNALCPGFFASEANGPEAMEAMNDFIETRSAMCRPGNPGELDSSIVYLAAKESSYVTAAILTCDGGWTAV